MSSPPPESPGLSDPAARTLLGVDRGGAEAQLRRSGWRLELHDDGVAPLDVREAFEGAFRAVDPGHRDRLASQWRWRSAEVPDGARAVCVRDGLGRVLAWYAAQVLRARVPGSGDPRSGDSRSGAAVEGEAEARAVAQVIDTFASPCLGPVQRAEAFVLACERFMDAYCGPGAGRLGLCFGLPVRPAWRLGRARLGYEVLGNAWWFERAVPADDGASARDDVPAVRTVDQVDEALAPRLERGIARALAATPVHLARDAAWVRWRFLRDPVRPWNLGLCEQGGEVLGLAAWRRAERDLDGVGGPTAHVAELLARPDRPDVLGALEAWLERGARAAGLGRLLTLAGDADPEFEGRQGRGWVARRAERCLVGRSFERRRDAAWWGRNLRWTLADTDLPD